jgi:hypothetical protein
MKKNIFSAMERHDDSDEERRPNKKEVRAQDKSTFYFTKTFVRVKEITSPRILMPDLREVAELLVTASLVKASVSTKESPAPADKPSETLDSTLERTKTREMPVKDRSTSRTRRTRLRRMSRSRSRTRPPRPLPWRISSRRTSSILQPEMSLRHQSKWALFLQELS